VKRAVLLGAWALLTASACVEGQGTVDCADFVLSPTQYHMQFAGRPGMLTQQELTFICHATVLGTAQVMFAEMALIRAQHREVRDFAQKVADEQGQLNQRLTQIATEQEGVTPPAGLDAPGLAMRERLAGLSGDAFDRAYMEDAVDGTRSAVVDFRQEATSGVEPILLRLAVNSLPALEARLELAQSIVARLATVAPQTPAAR
jgi:putative membrane protein